MKRILKIVAVAFLVMLGSSLRNKASAQYSSADVSYQTFYDELSPYGSWIDYPEYGYVWQPRVSDDFRPYSSGGHWVWSDDYEWKWVSDYNWGWAPFHYGRWFNDPSYGWMWVPGYEWSSAWVAWRDGGDYYGWAPLRPGINIGINFLIGAYSPPNDYWCFAPRRYITSNNIYNYCVDRRQNVTIINYTTIINNYNYGRNGFRTGPRRYEAERYCGTIRPVSFRESYRPGRTEFRNNEVSIYRPNVRRNDNDRFTPRKFERYEKRDNNNGTVRNDNGSRRNNNDIRKDDNVNTRDNNQPFRRDRDNNTPVERRNPNDEVKQPQNNNGNNNKGSTERRRFDRNDDNNKQSVPNKDVKVPRQIERPDANPNNNNGNNDNGRFERRNDNSKLPVRQPGPDTRNQGNNPQRQSSPQVETKRQQEQPRQFERPTVDNKPQVNKDGNNGNRNSRKRF